MNVNQHTYNNLYKSKVNLYSTIQYSLNVLCILSLTSVFLYGAYNLVSTELSYLSAIAVVAAITIITLNFKKKLYWYLRPKINQNLFANLFALTNLIYSLLCIILISLNFEGDLLELEFGTLGSTIFILGLPLSYYMWLTFSQTNEKSIIEFISSTGLNNYKNYEVYLIIIFVAVFGLIYDYLPQTTEVLFLIPVAVLVVTSLLTFILNGLIHRSVLAYFQGAKSVKDQQVQQGNIIGLYEKRPYELIPALKNDFYSKSLEEQKYILFTLKRICAVDAIPHLDSLLQAGNETSEIRPFLESIYDYLLNINEKIEGIDNYFEFIEQSNDLIVIKGLIRKQILNEDKNLIIKLLNDNRVSINKPACIVAGYYSDINIISILIERLENPEINHWALKALERIGEKAIKYIEIEFSKRKENLLFVDSSFTLLCKIAQGEGLRLLFQSLNETDSNIRKIAAKKIILHEVKVSEDHRKYFKKLFDDLVLTLLSNSYLIKQLELKNENFNSLKSAIVNENKESLFIIINIFKLYYNPAITEKIFKFYNTKVDHLNAASYALIDLLLADNISVKNKLKVLFSPTDRLLLETLQEEYPSVNLKPTFEQEEDIIWLILRKEYDQINSWTRANALNILQYTFKEDIPFELASEFLNENQLLKETAAINIYKNLPEFYTIFLDRLSKNEAVKIDYLIRSNLDIGSPKQINQDNLLLIDKLNFLISIPYLNRLSISEIINFHRYFKTRVLRAGEHQINLLDEENLGFWLIESGNISFSKNGQDYYDFEKREIIKVTDHDSPLDNVYFYCEQEVRFLVVEEVILINIIQDYDAIMQKYIDILPDKSPSKIIKKIKQFAA